jgi:hypothetical protein
VPSVWHALSAPADGEHPAHINCAGRYPRSPVWTTAPPTAVSGSSSRPRSLDGPKYCPVTLTGSNPPPFRWKIEVNCERAWGAQACHAAIASDPREAGHFTMNQATVRGTG